MIIQLDGARFCDPFMTVDAYKEKLRVGQMVGERELKGLVALTKIYIRKTNRRIGYGRALSCDYEPITIEWAVNEIRYIDKLLKKYHDLYKVAGRTEDDMLRRNHASYIMELENVKNKLKKAIVDMIGEIGKIKEPPKNIETYYRSINVL